MEVSLTRAFSTPILTYNWPKSDVINSELLQLARNMVKSEPTVSNSNVGGYHSDTQFIHRNVNAVREVKSRILQLTKVMGEHYGLAKTTKLEASLAGWINVMQHGNYHRLHSHPDCHWSGVYYVCTGKLIPDTKPNGVLQFQDPRSGANRLTIEGLELAPSFSIVPAPGLMAMFPSYLEHYVHPFFGEGERVSIAFNVKVTKIL